MVLGCHFVYDLTQAEIVVRDMIAKNDTYYYGQALKFGATDGTDRGTVTTAGAGTGLLAGVCNEGGVNNAGKVLGGTVATGLSETLKAIVNPMGVFRIQYDDSALITWGTVTDTTIPFACTTAQGHTDFGGGWAWSYNTGKLDWVVSSNTSSTTCTLTTVTGTDTTSTSGILIYPQGKYVVELNSTGTKIAKDIDVATAKSNGFNAVILGNQIVSTTYAVEKLIPAKNASVDGSYNLVGVSAPTPSNRMNQAVRYMISQTTDGKTRDKARAFADVCFGPASAYLQVS